jgi:hypothetical protein
VLLKNIRISFQNSKRFAGRIWSGHLVCSNLIGLLFGTLVENGALKPWEIMTTCVGGMTPGMPKAC